MQRDVFLHSWWICFNSIEGFEINDHDGSQLSDDDVLHAHYYRLQAFQLLAFKKVPKVTSVDKYQVQQNDFIFFFGVPISLVTFVMLEDWWWQCLEHGLDCMFSVTVHSLSNAMSYNQHLSFSLRDLIALL